MVFLAASVEGVADNLAGRRATKNRRSFEVTAQLIYKLTSLQQRSSAKGEHAVLSLTFIMVNPTSSPHFATTYIVPSSYLQPLHRTGDTSHG